MNPDFPGDGPFYDPDGCGNGPTMFFMSIGVDLCLFGADWMRSGGEFWRVLAIFGHFLPFLAISGPKISLSVKKCHEFFS